VQPERCRHCAAVSLAKVVGNGDRARAAKGPSPVTALLQCQVWQAFEFGVAGSKPDHLTRPQSLPTTGTCNNQGGQLGHPTPGTTASGCGAFNPTHTDRCVAAAPCSDIPRGLVLPCSPIATLTPSTECDCLCHRLLSSILAISDTRNGVSGPSAAEFASFRPSPVPEVSEHCRAILIHPAPRD
jgi:hypothetical protein